MGDVSRRFVMSVRPTLAVPIALALLVSTPGFAQGTPSGPESGRDGGAIHGAVELRDGTVREGAIAWGDRKRFWNERLAGVLREDLQVGERTENVELFGMKLWEWKERDTLRLSIAVPFGLIRAIDRVDHDELEVTLPDGSVLGVRSSGRDVGAKPTIVTASGTFTPDWDDVRRVTFSTSADPGRTGERIYGTVTTELGPYTGFVAWDRDERVLDEMLDGDEAEMPFAEIAEIHRDGSRAARVVLRDGSEMRLSGTNDVNDRNRGIEVLVDGLGTIVADWDAFESFVLAPPPASPPRAVLRHGRMVGVVETTTGERHRGALTWGDHERFLWETLDGELSGDVEVAVPFDLLRRVAPLDERRGVAQVVLRSGVTFEIRGGDVDADARAVEIATPAGPVRVAWNDIVAVEFGPGV
jgi:hypothetical protein